MIDIASADFSIGVPPLGERALRASASRVFDSWDARLASSLPVPDYALYFELEEGSLNGKGRVAATLFAVYIAIGQFGSFSTGLREMASVGKASGEFLLDEAKSLIPYGQNAAMRSRRGAGRVGQLERLFERVRRREIEPAEATEEARRLFADQGDESPDVVEAIIREIGAAPRAPEQLRLELAYSEPVSIGPADSEDQDEAAQERRRGKSPVPPIPPPTRYRVEVWRESRKKRRHIVVAPL